MKKTSLKTNALLNGVKQGCSVLFPLVTFPYVSRVLGSEAYGKYNFGCSYVNYFLLLAALGTAAYAVREGPRFRNRKQDLQNFADELFSINILMMCLSCGLLLLSLILWRKLDVYRTLILVQSTAIILNTAGADWINSIFEDFRYLTLRYVVFQFIAAGAMFLLVRSPEDYIIYAAVNTFANYGANILNLVYTRKKYLRIRFTLHMNLKHHIFPLLILFCNTLAVTLYVNSDVTLIGVFMTDEDVGKYSIAAKIYNIVKQLLNAVTVVIIPRAAYLLGNKELKKYHRLLNSSLKILFYICIPAITVIYVLAEEIVFLAGGEEYSAAVLPLRILCTALCFSVLACFFSNGVLIVGKKEKAALKATVTGAVVNIILNLVFIPGAGIAGAALTTAAAEFSVFLISMRESRGCWERTFRFREAGICIVGSVFAAGTAFLIKIFVSPVFIRAFLAVLSAGTVYAGFLAVLKDEIALAGLKMAGQYIRSKMLVGGQNK